MGGLSSRRETQGAEAEWWGRGRGEFGSCSHTNQPPSVVEWTGGRQTGAWESGGGRGSRHSTSRVPIKMPSSLGGGCRLTKQEVRAAQLAARGEPARDKGAGGSWQAGGTWRACGGPDGSGQEAGGPRQRLRRPSCGRSGLGPRQAGGWGREAAGAGLGAVTSTLPWRPRFPPHAVQQLRTPGLGRLCRVEGSGKDRPGSRGSAPRARPRERAGYETPRGAAAPQPAPTPVAQTRLLSCRAGSCCGMEEPGVPPRPSPTVTYQPGTCSPLAASPPSQS